MNSSTHPNSDKLNNDMESDTDSNEEYSGVLEILKWPKRPECKWNTFGLSDTVYDNHSKVLKWIYENDHSKPAPGCPLQILKCKYNH